MVGKDRKRKRQGQKGCLRKTRQVCDRYHRWNVVEGGHFQSHPLHSLNHRQDPQCGLLELGSSLRWQGLDSRHWRRVLDGPISIESVRSRLSHESKHVTHKPLIAACYCNKLGDQSVVILRVSHDGRSGMRRTKTQKVEGRVG